MHGNTVSQHRAVEWSSTTEGRAHREDETRCTGRDGRTSVCTGGVRSSELVSESADSQPQALWETTPTPLLALTRLFLTGQSPTLLESGTVQHRAPHLCGVLVPDPLTLGSNLTVNSSSSDPLSTHWSRIDALYGPEPEAAWNWFVDRYRPFVREVLSAVLPPTTDVASADSEFWGYFYLSRVVERSDRQRRFRALLFGTVRNFARRWRGSSGVAPMPNEELEALTAEDSTASTASRLWAQSVLHNGLSQLRAENPLAADALAMFYGVEWTQRLPDERAARSAAEVAAALGLPPGGIYMHLHRSRARLRQILESELRESCTDEESFRDELGLLLRIAATRVPGLME